jgi:hypothetical protein
VLEIINTQVSPYWFFVVTPVPIPIVGGIEIPPTVQKGP